LKFFRIPLSYPDEYNGLAVIWFHLSPWTKQAKVSLKEYVEKGFSPEKVTVQIIAVLQSRQLHYVVGFDAKLVSRRRFIPAKAFHKSLRRKFGFNKV